MLPDRAINEILQKFGPQIVEYLRAVGYFGLEGSYSPLDLIDAGAIRKYVRASKSKNTEVWRVVEKLLLPELEGTGEAFIAAYGLQEVIPVKALATKYIESRGGEFIKKVTATDKQRLVNFIWQDSGKNERVLAREILKQPNLSSIVDNSGFRARTIIRTEKARATRGGSHACAGSAGATTKTWHTVGDKRVRPTHRALNGTKIKIDEDFPGEGQYPGSVSINCRCWLEYGFDKSIADNPNPSEETLQELYGEAKAKATPEKVKFVSESTTAPKFVPAATEKEARQRLNDLFSYGMHDDLYLKAPGFRYRHNKSMKMGGNG